MTNRAGYGKSNLVSGTTIPVTGRSIVMTDRINIYYLVSATITLMTDRSMGLINYLVSATVALVTDRSGDGHYWILVGIISLLQVDNGSMRNKCS